MKKILLIILLFPIVLIGQSNDQNYIKTKTYKAKSTEFVSGSDIDVSISYLDGLGRPKQAIAVAAGGAGQDIVMPVVYDNLGRQTRQYLPYANPTGTIANSSQNYIDNATLLSTQKNYYGTKYPTDVTGSDPQTYSGVNLEQSPLNRVADQTFPGAQWATGGRTVKTEYGTNTVADAVYNFRVSFIDDATDKPNINLNGASINSQYYEAGSLYKIVSKDENWISTDGNNKTIHEYKDKQGRLILKRQFNEDVPHDTYYVYDSFGNLTYVIPPQAFVDSNFITSTSVRGITFFTIDQVILEKYSYIYKYNSNNLVIEKQIPGKGVDYIVYDRLDRPVLTQSANQRDANGNGLKWLFTKYDKFNRIVYTGEYTSTATRASVQTSLDFALAYSETKSALPFTANGLQVYYTKSAYPTANLELFTVNYYDDYVNFPKPNITVPAATDYDTLTTSVKTLPTASVVRVLDSSVTQWTTTVMGYDAKGRLIWSKNNNAYYTTTNTSQIKLDFTGKVVETKVNHARADGSPLTLNITDTYTYDYGGRPAIHTQKINNAATAETISSKVYNELGQLIENRVGGNTQIINYTYNIRGWLTSINNPTLLNGDAFAESIAYNNPVSGTALYNGNISQVSWKTLSDNQLRKYNYTYDALNRIKTATFTNSSNSSQNNSYNLTNVTYDRNGNITFMQRNGTSAQTDMDKMTYLYDGNILQRVREDGITNVGFKGVAPTNTAVQYGYDKQGNLTSDINKNIATIEYNYLDLPTKVTFNNGSYIQYIYDAQGTKLKKMFFNGTGTTATEYVNGFIYLKSGTAASAIQYIPTEEGYAYKNTGGTYSYAYQLKDHLGNVRVSVTDVNGSHTITATEIIEESNFDPFGLKHGNYNVLVNSFGNSLAQKLEYNGKEFEEASSYNMNEMDWRHYEPALGRWLALDPVIHFSTSPYSAFENNPVFWSDPSGLDVKDEGDRITFTGADAGSFFVNYVNYLDSGSKEDFYFQSLPNLTIEGFRTPWGVGLGQLSQVLSSHVYSHGDVYQYLRDQWLNNSIHKSLDVIGFVDPFGVADAINAVMYTSEGNYAMAAISAVAIIPFGDLLKGGKYLNKIAQYEKLADGVGTRAYIKEFNNTTAINTTILFNDITQGGTKSIINTPNGQIINSMMSDGSIISLRNFSTKSGGNTHTTIQFGNSQTKWKFNN